MYTYFLNIKKIVVKFAIVSGALSALIGGVYIFWLYENDLGRMNYRVYYARTYIAALGYSLKSTKAYFASMVTHAKSAQVLPLAPEKEHSAQALPVLIYHGFLQKSDGFNVSVENFIDQMFMLKNAGWQTVTLADMAQFIQGKKELPDKSFVLTFDDGRRDSYYPADPILRVLGYNAVMFVITGLSFQDTDKKNPFYLSEEELKEMKQSGRWDLQSHGKNDHVFYPVDSHGNKGHFLSNKLWRAEENRLETEAEFEQRIQDDLIHAKDDLEKRFGTKIINFAYPFGDFGQNSINFPESKPIIANTVSSLYSFAFYQIWRGGGFSYNYPRENTFMIKRITVEPEWNGKELLNILEGGKPKELPYYDAFARDRGWAKSWGKSRFENQSLIIEADDTSEGASIFLDGSYDWRDYDMSAKVRVVKGQSFSVIARYKDKNNYAFCTFTPVFARIEEVVNGEHAVLAEEKGHFLNLEKDSDIQITVNQDKINCASDGLTPFAKALFMDTSLDSGGIGFKTWDPAIHNHTLIIKEVRVNPS